MLPSLLAAEQPDPMGHVLPHGIFDSPWFTNHHFMSLIVLIGGIFLLIGIAKAMPMADGKTAEDFVTKGRVAQFFETLCVFLRDEMTRPLLGKMTDKYIYYVWSVFFFILFANLLGLIPVGALLGLTLQSYPASHLWGTFTGNINFTAGIAIFALIMMVFVGLKENGLGFVKHMWPVPVTSPEGVEGPMLFLVMPILWAAGFLVFLLELIGYVIKSFALCVRLFANMVAGHLVLGSLIIMALTTSNIIGKGMTVVGASVFTFLELFVAFLQAYIFAFLTVIFMSLGAVHHYEHDEHEAGLDEGEKPGEAIEESLTGTVSPSH